MPAAEQTWRSQKKLHVVFGISSVVLLLSTLWMFKADHQREWKEYQRTGRKIDVMMTEWRKLAFEQNDYLEKMARLEKAVVAARAVPIDAQLLVDFEDLIQDEPEVSPQAGAGFQQAVDSHRAGGTVAESRDAVTTAMEAVIQEVRFREDLLLNDRKFRSADLDKAKANYGLAIRDGRSRQVLDQLRAAAESIEGEVTALNLEYQRFSTLRDDLQDLRKNASAGQEAAEKEVSDTRADLEQLDIAIRQRHAGWVEDYWLGKRWLELPILDAFNTPLKIVNNWSDDLEQDYSHRRVRRFDRCATCHQMMEKTLPGSATEGGYMKERLLRFSVQPGTPPADGAVEQNVIERLSAQFGFSLAGEGLVGRDDVTISYVKPKSVAASAVVKVEPLAKRFRTEEVMLSLLQVSSEASPVRPDDQARDARPGLEAGDVLVLINGDPVIEDSRRVAARLLALARQGKPLEITVRRGMPNPFTTHPRLDLFVGSLSPHTVADFACTICHDGQGSATAFKWSSHTPDSPQQRERWLRENSWFDNTHWIFPMYSKRFTESSCLKCHHELTELAASDRFPDPPAPTLMKGYDLIRKYGCYGCHEINGFEGPDKRLGPDMRLEPNYFAVAQQLQAEAGFEKLDESQQRLVRQLVDHPENDSARHQLLSLLEADAAEEETEPRFSDDVHGRLIPLLGNVTAPGTQRRPGPSLRYLASKLESPFLQDWIQHPLNFRPSTRMPQFFGLWDHLPGKGVSDPAEQFEPLEVYAISYFLLQSSQSYAYLDPPSGITAPADVERGKVLFKKRGCLACHSHNHFGDVEAYRNPNEILQGPDLSNLAVKFDSPNGRRWLYSWIREPTRYHARTVMPNLFLEKITHRDVMGNVTGVVTDPAADLVEYLTSTGNGGWAPAEETIGELDGRQQEDFDSLALEHLEGTYYVAQAREYLERGIPDLNTGEVKGPEVELLVPQQDYDEKKPLSLSQKLMYVGRRSIAKYGCYGCHDIPGFEEAKPIGTTLADWGRKETSKLAYEHILEYLGLGHHGGDHAGHGDDHGHDHGHDHAVGEREVRQGHFDDQMPEFFEQQLQSHNRIGFLYQKLREPRGYDFEKTHEKGYNERLRMPRFPFSTEERQQVMTFILGLVSDPPRAKYIYQPDRRSTALQQGERVLKKYNCRGCHLLTPEKWDVAFTESEVGEGLSFPPAPPRPSYPFAIKEFSPAAIATSRELDHRNQMHATLVGMPVIGQVGLPDVYDRLGDTLELSTDSTPKKVKLADITHVSFDLWEPLVVAGNVYQVGKRLPTIKTSIVTRRQSADGGVLARYLLTQVDDDVDNAKVDDGWSWVPPPLVGEGLKVQTSWLHDFLLDPYPIRPAVVLRMPRFNMSPAEATALVNYFAARDDVDYPYTYTRERDQELLAAREIRYLAQLEDPAARVAEAPEGVRLHDAIKIITKADKCVTCHIIGDYSKQGPDHGKAPDLARVFERLRPDFLRRWIANPPGVLPYTKMPVNISLEDTPDAMEALRDLYPGTPTEQIDALVDLLMNYDKYTQGRTSVRSLVEAAAAAAAAAKQNESSSPVDPPAEGDESGEESGEETTLQE